MQLTPTDTDILLENALILTLIGRKTEAVEALSRAVAAGYSPKRLEDDPDLAPLSDLPGFSPAGGPPALSGPGEGGCRCLKTRHSDRRSDLGHGRGPCTPGSCAVSHAFPIPQCRAGLSASDEHMRGTGVGLAFVNVNVEQDGNTCKFNPQVPSDYDLKTMIGFGADWNFCSTCPFDTRVELRFTDGAFGKFTTVTPLPDASNNVVNVTVRCNDVGNASGHWPTPRRPAMARITS